MHHFQGGPFEIGFQHGRILAPVIRRNTTALLGWHANVNAACLSEADAWVQAQSRRHFGAWPWLEDEMRGIAQGAKVGMEEILKLNFRVWQYRLFGAGHGCSNLAVILESGETVVAGTLDDPREFYAAVDMTPANGESGSPFPGHRGAPGQSQRFISFPIAGTAWANRGINRAGLAMGISSLPLAGLRFDPDRVWQQDLCMRVMMQTCRTCEDVLEFCRLHPFAINIVVADATGRSIALTSTPMGAFVLEGEIPCLTNHLPDPLRAIHLGAGWDGGIRGRASIERHGQLTQFASMHRKSTTIDLMRVELSRVDGTMDQCVNNKGTAFATIAFPQAAPPAIMIAETPVTRDGFTLHKLG